MYTDEHWYVTAIGDAYGGTERWQFGLRMSLGAGQTAVTLALLLSDDYQNWWTNTTGAGFTAVTTHRLTELKVARVGPDGLYVPGSVSYSHFYLPPIAGTIEPPAGQLPQATIAVTLTTAIPRGLASKGRVYLPPSALYLPVAATGLISVVAADQLATSVKTLLNGINAAASGVAVQVMSRGKGVATYDAEHKRVEYSYPNPGATAAVTGVRVGRVVDTQRRRRRQLGELPQSLGL